MSKWTRVSKRQRCPICDHADWCLLAPDGGAVLCMRAMSEKSKRLGNGAIGYIHKLGESQPRREYIPATSAEVRLDVPKIMSRYAMDTTPHMLAELAESLGVDVSALQRLGAAWSKRHEAWAFPMQDPGLNAIGIRLRNDRGDKFAIRGSKAGLFIPDLFPAHAGPVLICEGPTDTAAMLSLGFDVVGRPSCSSCGEMLRHLLAGERREIVIVQDADKLNRFGRRPGQEGAAQLAADLRRACKIITPLRGKDAREWKNIGASHAVVTAVIQNTKYWTKGVV